MTSGDIGLPGFTTSPAVKSTISGASKLGLDIPLSDLVKKAQQIETSLIGNFTSKEPEHIREEVLFNLWEESVFQSKVKTDYITFKNKMVL